jgi:uncharacterized alkaline shock family protein YloU
MTDFSADNLTSSNGPSGPTPFAPPSRAEENPTPPSGSPTQPPGAGSPGSSSIGPAPFGRPTASADQANGGAQRIPPTTQEVKGRIEVADEVVEKVAALAAMEVPGVADLGGDIARALESVRERIGVGQKRGDQGIKAKVEDREVSVDVTIVIEYGYVVMDVARQVKNNVANQTGRMLGLRVTEVNVKVDDVKLPQPAKEEEPAEDDAGLLPID